jgi:hypothetical protein
MPQTEANRRASEIREMWMKQASSPRGAVAFSTLDMVRQLRSAVAGWLGRMRVERESATAAKRNAASEAIVDSHRPWLRVYLPPAEGKVGVAELR